MSGYKDICPECNGHNFYITPENGKAYCFNCGHYKRGENNQQAIPKRSKYKKEIRAFYKEVSEYFHRCLWDNYEALMYYFSRGITEDTIKDLSLGYVPTGRHPLCKLPECYEAGLTRDHNTWFQGGRVSFPFIVNEEITDIWARSLTNDEPRYLGPNHSAYQRWADYPYLYDDGYNSNTVVLTEGIIKPILPHQAKIEGTIGFPGTLSRREFTPYKGQKVVICFDSQRKNRKQLIAAIDKKANTYPNSYVATLPLRGKDKQDIDSYIQQFGVEEYRKVIDNALPHKEWKQLV
jgi:DNA primase